MVTERQFWNFRAQAYDDQIGPKYEETYRLTAEHALKYLQPSDQILEFACGTGIVTLSVAPYVSTIQAIDISDEMVSRAQAKVEASQISNVTVSQTDLFDPCLVEGSYDAVMAFNVLLYIENFEEVMARVSKLLKPGGVFLSATDCLLDKFTKSGWQKFWRSRTGKMPYVGFYTQKGLAKRIEKSGFEILETENLFPSPPNLFVAAKKLD